jgi:hypothetical protein
MSPNKATLAEIVLPVGTRVQVDRSILPDNVWLVIEEYPGSDIDGAHQSIVAGLSHDDAAELARALLEAIETGGRSHPVREVLATLPADVCE